MEYKTKGIPIDLSIVKKVISRTHIKIHSHKKGMYDPKPKIENKYSISIITLVRNNKQYLKISIGSLIEQTNSNWESIIINDGSNEKIEYSDFLSKEQIKIYKNKIKIINNDNWSGIIKCHKLGIINSTKEIVGILDCDDKLDSTAIDKILNLYNNNINENIFVYTNFYYCDENLNIIKKGYSKNINKNLLNERKASHLKTFNRKFYFLTEGYDDDLIFGSEDQDILFKLEEYCVPIFIDEPLYYYRTYTEKNITNSISSLKKISKYSYYLSIFKNILSRYNNLNFYVKIFNSVEDSNYLKFNNLYKETKIIDNVKYFLQLQSNDINIITIYETDLIDVDNYIKIYKNTNICLFDVNIDWDYMKNKIIITDKNTFNLTKFKLIHPNTYFDEIYIINLKQEKTKKDRIINIFNKYNIKCTFIKAINGYSEKNIEKHKETVLKSPGVLGYSLSMINIFNDAINKNHNKILICDDDIILHKNFDIKFDEYIKSVPFSWKVLFFGLSGPWSFNKNTFLYNFNFDKKYTTNLISCDGSFCVGYDKSMFNTIIDITNKFELPFDTGLIKYLNNNLSIEKYAFYPQIVIADTVKKSTIVNYQEEMSTIKNFERNHLRFMVNLNNFDLNSMENNKYNELKII